MVMPWIHSKTDEQVLDAIWAMPYSCIFDAVYEGIEYDGSMCGQEFSCEAIGAAFSVSRTAINEILAKIPERMERQYAKLFREYAENWQDFLPGTGDATAFHRDREASYA